jgi:hypothetical protein
MTSARKIAANKANAKASTGPRTSCGKSRAAQNARRHGLSLSIFSDPARAVEAKNLARKIAGKGASSETYEQARRVADAQIDLIRIRQASHELFRMYLPSEEKYALKTEPKRAKEFAIELLDLTERLTLIDRYERRALSRRKCAARRLDAVHPQASL